MSELRSPDKSLGLAPPQSGENLLDWLFALRDHQREHQGKGAWLIRGNELKWEHNRQGKMKWFLHPALEDVAVRSMLVFEQEIPPGGKTGVQATPGGTCMYIIEGRGHTLLDGQRHDWQAEDVVQIPLRRDGVRVQHVNDDPRRPVRFIAAEVNMLDILGVDRGAAFEQIEDAPASEN